MTVTSECADAAESQMKSTLISKTMKYGVSGVQQRGERGKQKFKEKIESIEGQVQPKEGQGAGSQNVRARLLLKGKRQAPLGLGPWALVLQSGNHDAAIMRIVGNRARAGLRSLVGGIDTCFSMSCHIMSSI